MLKQIYQSVPLPYLKRNEYHGDGFFGVDYHVNIEPFIEKVNWISAVWTAPWRTLHSPTSVYVLAVLDASYSPSWSIGFYRFDGSTGQVYARMPPTATVSAVEIQSGSQSRVGTMFFRDIYGMMWKFNLGRLATELLLTGETGDEDPPTDTYTLEATLGSDHFEDMSSFGEFGVDDLDDRFLNSSGTALNVYVYSTGKFLYGIEMPSGIADIALEDKYHAYVLLTNRVLVLVDYYLGGILGAVKIPTLESGADLANNNNIRMSWDPVCRRVLICETVPDAASGASRTVVKGYRAVPVPTRLTLPIPLQAPRHGRIIPVMSQIVGDMNEGVGGHIVASQVSGSGSLVGAPLTDHRGVALSYVACEGNRFYAPSPAWGDEYGYDEYYYTGSPDASVPNMGLIDITNTVRVYQPDPPDLPPLGIIPLPGWTPGDPGGPGEPPGPELDLEAPNMFFVLEKVLARGGWNLAGTNTWGPNGRGAFTEAAAIALHDVDPRFGHLDKADGTGESPNRYNGHATDAVMFKNDDGLTAEDIDIIIGSAEGGLQWVDKGRSTGNRSNWKYPA